MGSVTSNEFDVVVLGCDALACAITRDAVGRGLRVVQLCEGDIGGSFAQQILLEGLVQAHNKTSVSDEEQVILHRVAPHLGLTLAVLDNAETFSRTLSPNSAHRFAILSARDAADRGAVIRVHSGKARYTELGLGWAAITETGETFHCKLIVDARPNVDQNSGGAFARVAVYQGNLAPDSPTPDSGKTHGCYNFDTNTFAVFVTSSSEVGDQKIMEAAQPNSGSTLPLWTSPTFFQPDFAKTFDMTQTPPLFRVTDAGDFNWRSRAELVVAEMAPFVQMIGKPWTRFAKLPGGDFQTSITKQLFDQFKATTQGIDDKHLMRLFSSYGTEAGRVLGSTDHGVHFGHGLFEAEVDWLVQHEWVQTAQDVLWRRTHLGLVFDPGQVSELENWVTKRSSRS